MKNFLKLIRLPHWLKNVLIFAPFVFSGSFRKAPEELFLLFGYFLFFSLFVSGLYVLNDFFDRKEDVGRDDKVLASGRVSTAFALLLAFLLLSSGLGFFLTTGWPAFPVVLVYSAVFLAYNLFFKKHKYLDVLWVPLGYPLRALIGAYAIEVPPSPWLFLLTYLGGAYLLLGKRVYEANVVKKRTVLALYGKGEPEQLFSLFLPITVSAYGVFACTRGEWFWITIFPVLYLVLKYLDHVKQGKSVDSFLASPPFIIFSWIWGVLVMFFV